MGVLTITLIFGLALAPTLTFSAALVSPANALVRRVVTPNGTCGLVNSGANKGYTCPTTGKTCCSQWGWCGSDVAYCGSGCQTAYGKCGTAYPNSRAKVGSVPYGTIIEKCTVPNTVALTFDDGPHIYTAELLNLLKSNQAKATFFINGNNYGNINTATNKALVKRMWDEGHQIGSHTWSHADLTTLTATQIRAEMVNLENALKGILAVYPSYMRSPYFSTNSAVLSQMASLGYHTVHADIDTLDWEHQNGASDITISINIFKAGVDAGGTIELSHDPLYWSAGMLATNMIRHARARGKKMVTVGECLGDPKTNWYRTGS